MCLCKRFPVAILKEARTQIPVEIQNFVVRLLIGGKSYNGIAKIIKFCTQHSVAIH